MFFREFGRGVSSHIDAIKFAWKHRLGWYFVVPLLLSVLLFFVGIHSVWSIGIFARDKFIDWVSPYIDSAGDGSFLLTFLAWLLGVIVQGLIGYLLVILLLKLVRYIILILISPILALVSERVEEILTGKKNSFEFKQFLKDMLRGITVSLRNMFIELGLLLLTFLMLWIPVMNILAVPAGALFSWYFLGFNMMDYTYERRRMKISEGAAFTRKHKGLAMGNGLVYSLLVYIPIVGISFGPVLSVIAATIVTVEKMEKK